METFPEKRRAMTGLLTAKTHFQRNCNQPVMIHHTPNSFRRAGWDKHTRCHDRTHLDEFRLFMDKLQFCSLYQRVIELKLETQHGFLNSLQTKTSGLCLERGLGHEELCKFQDQEFQSGKHQLLTMQAFLILTQLKLISCSTNLLPNRSRRCSSTAFVTKH